MRLHAYITQALYPGQESLRFAQLPGINQSEAEEFAKESHGFEDLTGSLEEKQDGRLDEIKKVVSRWGKLDLVDASFKGIFSGFPSNCVDSTIYFAVIGDRLVTPSSFVYLVVKARLSPPVSSTFIPKASDEAVNDDQRDNEFLNSRKDVEEIPEEESASWAHAPYWPSVSFAFPFGDASVDHRAEPEASVVGCSCGP